MICDLAILHIFAREYIFRTLFSCYFGGGHLFANAVQYHGKEPN